MSSIITGHLICVITQVLTFDQLDSFLQNIVEKAIKLTLGGML